jgi:Carbohydrate-selective porin, OprB family
MNHFLRLSWLTTPALLGLLAWSTLPEFSGANIAAHAAQPKKAASAEAQQTKTSEPSTATLESQQFSSINHPVGEVVYGVQFFNVKPTDWAYQSLELLVKRSGCLVGAPAYFQPDRAPTRDELAAGLNACLSRMGDRFATKEDRELAQSLQTEFKPELAALKERVDRLQAQNATLKSQQFSTTTKIQGQVVITFQNGF